MIEQELGPEPSHTPAAASDLVSRHHENERAQGNVRLAIATGLRQLLLPQRFLNMGDEKMSKSVGPHARHNLLSSKGEVIRWALLDAHYRQPLAWTDDALASPQLAGPSYGVLGRARISRPAAAAPVAQDQLDRVLRTQTRLRGMSPEEARNDLDARSRKEASTARRLKQDLMAPGPSPGLPAGQPRAGSGRRRRGLRCRSDGLIAARGLAAPARTGPRADRICADYRAKFQR